MILLPDGRLVAVVRLYDKKVRTALCWVDPKAGTIKEFLALPSGGDTSYAGIVFKDGLLWISYYSSHEGKTSIYFAKVKIPASSSKVGKSPVFEAPGLTAPLAFIHNEDLSKPLSSTDARGLRSIEPSISVKDPKAFRFEAR